MSQIITRKVFTYSSASTQHPIEITGEEDTILNPETFPSSYEAAVAESPHSEIDQGGGIAFKIHGSKDANPAYTKQSSTKIVRTLVTNKEEKKQLANEAALNITTTVNSNTEQRLAKLQENIQTTNRHSTSAANEDPGKHTNVDSTNITATSRRRSKTSYTYRVHDGIAVLENVTRYQPETQTITNFAREKPKHTEISNVSFEINTEDLATNQDHDVQKQNTFRTNLAFQSKPKTIFTQMDMVSKSENRAVREISGNRHTEGIGQPSTDAEKRKQLKLTTRTTAYHATAQNSSQGERQLIDTPQETQKSPKYSYSVTSPGPSHKIFGSEVYGEKSITQPQHQKERLPSTNTKQITTQHQTTNISDSGKLIIPNFTQYTSTNQVKLCEPTPKDNNVKSDEKVKDLNTEEWVTQVVTQKDLRSEKSLPPNKLSAYKMQLLHNQDTQPEKNLDKSSPGRLVIPDFNQSTFTAEVKETTPSPKVDKLKTEEWRTQVVTNEEFRSEPTLQTNRLSEDKMKFLHNQNTQPEKNLDKSSPGRLVIPDFNQSSFTTEVKDIKPLPKVDKLKTERWATQVVTQEDVRSEQPSQANRLSADKMKFLHNQDTQPEKNLDKSSPGRLVIPDFNQSTFTTEVKETKTSPKVDKLKTEEWWVTQVITQEEVRSEPPLQANRLSADKMQFLHNQDTQPEKKLDKSSPGRLVIPDFNQSTFTLEVKETKPSPKVDKLKTEEWLTQVVTQEEVRSEPPLQANRLSADKMQFLHNQDKQPEKNLDKSSPGRLVIPEFNQSTSTTDVKETKPSPKVDKLKTEEWVSQVLTQEEIRSEPPLQANKLSADKMQFLHNQDTQREKQLDKCSPGNLLIPDFNQSTFTTEVKDTKPSPKVDKLKSEEWATQVLTQEEVRAEPPLQANRLSADKMQFLHNQATQPEKMLDKSSPGRLVIPDFNQSTFTAQAKETEPSPKVDKLKAEEWLTHVVTQEEVRSQPPLQANRLSADKMQFLHNQDTQPEKNLDKSSPGRLAIPDFNQSPFTSEVKESKPSPKVNKLKTEEWITQEIIQEKVRSEAPLQANKLSADKIEFLHNQDTQPEKKLDKSSPGRLAIPGFSQSTFTTEGKETKPSPKVNKLKTEEWVTQVVTQEEVRSEPPLLANRLSGDKMQFLHKQDTQAEKKFNKSSPGRLVIPDFSQSTSTTEAKDTKPSLKVDELKSEDWVTEVVIQEEVKSEPPLKANKLSADKIQFLHNHDTHPEKTFDKSSPGKLVIPDFNQSTFTSEVKETKSSPKVDKLKTEEWLTQVVTQEEVRSESPLQANRLSADKMQFLHNQDTQPEKMLDKSGPGRLVIPDFNQSTFTAQAKETEPSPNVDKLKAEEWVTQALTQEKIRSEPPLHANRLSADKMQFLHDDDTQPDKTFQKSSPGRLVIPDFSQSTFTTEVKETTLSPKVDKLKSEEWLKHVITQEKVRSEPSLQANRLSADKIEFLHNQDTQPEKQLDKSSPGRLVIPDFKQSTFTSEVKETKPSPKVDKLKTEEWLTKVVTQEEVRTEPPLQANRLSAYKMQFLHNQDTQPEKKLDKSSPGRLVIPEFSQSTFTTEGKETKPSPKVNKLKTEEWVTQVVTQEEVRSEPPLLANRLSGDKMQFLHNQDTQAEKKFNKSSPGRLVIPDFNQSTSTTEAQDTKPSLKVDELKSEDWVTEVVIQEEVRSEPPLKANRLSADKMQFLHNQDTHPEKTFDKSTPGKLVIPDFSQSTFTSEVKETKPSPKVDKLKTEEWLTQVVTQEEVRSQPPLQANRLSADKMQFLHNQDTQPEKRLDKSCPGRLVIPEFSKSTFTTEGKETKPLPKVNKLKSEEWVTQVVTQEEVRSEPPLLENRLSGDKMQFLHKQDTQAEKTFNKSSPGRLVIPDFNQSTSTTEAQDTKPSLKVDELKSEDWVTEVVIQEEVRSEPPLKANRLSADKMQFLHNQDTHPEKTFDKSTPGKLVIPDFNQSTFTSEVKETKPSPKVDKLKTEEWLTQVVTQEEIRSEPPLQANRLSADKMQFIHNPDTQPEKKLEKSSPGRLVIPEFSQSTFTTEGKETKPSPKVNKLKTEEWVTQVVTQEEVRSEPPLLANRLSGDKMQFLHKQDTQAEKKFNKSSPGRLVIPDFNQSTSTTEARDTKPSLKVDELKSEDWVTEVVIQEEVRSEPPLQANKLTGDKMQFLHNQNSHPEKTFDKSTPGKLVIPDFNQSTFTSEVKETKPSPKVDKLKTEEWLTQVVTQEEVRSEPPIQANRLSADKMQFLRNEDTRPEKRLDKSSPGRLVIPEFSQSTFTTVGKETKPSPKVNKLKTEAWVTQVVTQEEVRSEPPLLANRLSGDKIQFLHRQDTQAEKQFNKSSPGRLVIPDFNQSTSTTEAQDTKPALKVDELKSEDWVTEVVIQEEVRSEPPLKANRLSADKIQFLHNQDTQGEKKLNKSSPGRLVIPNFNQSTYTTEARDTKPSLKVDELKSEDWVTEVVIQEEVRSEPPLQANKLTGDKMQFLQNQDTHPEKTFDKSTPGKLVIPDFNQSTFTSEVKETKPSPKVDKLKTEEWLTQVVTQEEVRSEPPLQANRLSADKMQFLHNQDTQPEKKLDKSSPGRLVIPEFSPSTFTTEGKETKPSPKVNKLKTEEWVTQVVTQEEVRSEPPLLANRLSGDKMQFLHNQDTQAEKKFNKSSPGRLVIPDFNQSTSTTEAQDTKPALKVDELKSEDWVTEVVIQEEVRSEPPPKASRLSADKIQFLHNQDTHPEKTFDKSTPGKLVIPDFNQSTFTSEVKETKPSPKVDKLKTEEWLTQVVTQEKVRSEPPLQANKLSADKIQFLHNQDTHPEKTFDKSNPGKLVIPDFNQSTFTSEVKETKPSPKVDKLKTEEWLTQVVTQEEVRSEPPLQANRLSGDKMQFLLNQDTQPEKKLDKSSPGRLVIPEFSPNTFTTEGKETKPSPKVNKLKTEEWVTQVVTQEEVRSEPPLLANRLSGDKIQSLHNQDTQAEKKFNKSSPGRLVIPDFNQSTSTTKAKDAKPLLKVDELKSEDWVTEGVIQEEVRSEPPLQANRLSADKIQFLHNQDTHPEKTFDKSTPGKLVIPDFNQSTFTSEVKETKPSPKVDKLKTEEWLTQVVTQEEVRSEPPLQANRLSADKMQFLHNQDTQPEKKLDKSSPGRLDIPEFSQSTFTTEGKETKPSPKVNKLKSEEWVTQVVTQEEVRSEPPLLVNRLSGDKMQSLHKQDTQAEKKFTKSSPCKLVIPDFNQSTSTTEAKDVKPSLKVDELKREDWITEVVIQEEVRSEQPLQANKLSADKIQFLHNQDTHPEKTFDKSNPGKLVIPDFSQSTFTSEVKETKPSPKVDKLKTEEWLTQVVTQEEVRSEPPLQANRLSADKMHFLHKQVTQPEKTLDKSSPGRLVIPEFSQSTFTTEGKETKPSPKVNKLKTEEWVTQVVTQKEVRSEPPLLANRLSGDKMQFLHNQDTQAEKKFNKSSPGRLVIPDFNQSTSTTEAQDTKPSLKVDALKSEDWVTEVVFQEEVRSEPPLKANRLSADKIQFLHNQDTHPEKTFDKSNPGKLVIPDFSQSTFTSEVKETKPSPKVDKLKTEEWVTQVVTQEEVRSEPPLQANRLSADKMQFLHKQDTQPEKKLDKSSPGRLVIPEFSQSTFTTEGKETKPSPKLNKLKTEEWVTQVVTQEEVRSETPLLANRLSGDKMQFLHKQDTQAEKTFKKSSPGRLVIPDFSQSTSTTEAQDTKPSLKVDELKSEDWVTEVVIQEEVRSEPPLKANRLSADKMQFLHNQDTHPEKTFDKSNPGKLVIPDFSQSTFTSEVKETKPSPKVDKLKTEEWLTQVVTQEEVRSEPPLHANRLSADKMQFLHNQDTEPEEMLDKSSPGRLVIPDFNQNTFTAQVKETEPSPKVDKLKAEEWVTQVLTQEEIRSAPPLHANRLSADKIEFLHKDDTQPDKTFENSNPGRLVIPDFTQSTFTTEVKETTLSPKVDKLKSEEWVTQVVTQEKVRSEAPLPANRLLADKIECLHNQDTQPEKKLDKSSPGRLVIPDFNQSTLTTDVKETTFSPKVNKLRSEEWVTQVVTQEKVRSEPPLQANKLSADKMEFLHNQDIRPEKKLDKSSPGRLVIPELSQSTLTTEGKETKPSPKVNKLKTEEWVTQVVTQEEVRSEPPLLENRLSGDKMQFPHNQDTQAEKKFKKSSPGRLVIPNFNRSTSTTEAQNTKPSLKVDELKSEDWVTEVVIQEEVRSETPLKANKLSADKLQFLHNQDTHPEKTLHKSSPGKLVIPDFSQSTFTSEVKETKPSPKVDKLKTEEWLTQVVTQEEVRSEPPLQANRLSADKMQFLHKQDTQPEKMLDKFSTGRLVIPDFNQSTLTTQVKQTEPSPKVDKLKAEEWVTQVLTQEEIRSEPPLHANRLSADKIQFLHNQDTQLEKTFEKSSPGRLVIPDFSQSTFTTQVKETTLSPKVDKLKSEEWVTQVVTQEKVRSEPPLQANRLSADKIEFLYNQDTPPEKTFEKSSPGRLVIPEFNQSTFTTEANETKQSPKVDKLKTEEWVTQVITQEKVTSEPPLRANKLSADKTEFLHNQDTQPEKKLEKSSPGRLVIPEFSQSTFTTEGKETKPSPKLNKLKTEEWVTQVVTQEEVRSEPPLLENRLSGDKMQFLHNQDTQAEKQFKKSSPGRLVIPSFNQSTSTTEAKDTKPSLKVDELKNTHPEKTFDKSSTGKLVIPDFNQSTFTSEVKETKPPPKVDKLKTKEWLTQVVTQEEVRSEPPPQANRLSADKMQFLHNQDAQPEKNLEKSSPGRLWVTQVVTQQEVRSEPPFQANRLSADKVQFLHNQDTQPENKLDKFSPGRLVIPTFNQSTFTTEVKETKPSPKVDKLKTEEWLTQVVTQEEVKSEPPLQANRLSADKMQFLHNQDTQPEKKLDKSSPGRLVIPDFNQCTFTTEVKDIKPSPKGDKLRTEEWVSQVVTQEEVRSEPPLQTNRLSADKTQFIDSQDTESKKNLDSS
ncbi:unnamed protein product, partial [Pocillopora meandrina]